MQNDHKLSRARPRRDRGIPHLNWTILTHVGLRNRRTIQESQPGDVDIHRAFIIVPLVSGFFVEIANAIVIFRFLALFR
jgi:sodium--glutamate symport carrier gltS